MNQANQKTKTTPIGEIPVDWDCALLGDIALFKNGLNFLRSDTGYTYRIIGVTGFQRLFRPDASSFEEVSLNRELSPEEVLQGDDLLFVRSNGNKTLIGRCMIMPELSRPTGFSGFTIRARVSTDHAVPEYVARFMGSWPGRKQMLRLGGGTNISNLSQDTLRKISIPLPPLPEQRKIAEILSTWDRAIEQTEKLIQAKQQLKKGLMQKLLTGELRFPQFRGTPWRTCRLGDVFKERKETRRDDLPLLSITADRGVIPRDETDRKDISNTDKSKYKRVAPGDIGYNTMRMWQGVSALSELDGIVSPAYTICTPTSEILGEYASHLFKFSPMVNVFWRNSQGLVSDTLNLKYRSFARIKIQLPGVDEQAAIVAVLKEADEDISVLALKVQQLLQQKKGLMQKLLTGQIRTMTGGGT